MDFLWHAKQPIDDNMDFGELWWFFEKLKVKLKEGESDNSGVNSFQDMLRNR